MAKKKMKEVPLVESIDGQKVFNLCCSESNADWFRSARLKMKKDKKSKKEFEKMDEAPMLIDQN